MFLSKNLLMFTVRTSDRLLNNSVWFGPHPSPKVKIMIWVRIQKVALCIILKEDYLSYADALSVTHLTTLKARRQQLMEKFALKCTKNPLTKDMFPRNPSSVNTRNKEPFLVTKARTDRLKYSAIPSMQRILNKISRK